jgi:hypothetical protein
MNLFENLIGAVQVGGALALSPVLRSWYNRWGATEAEIQQPLSGDELVPVSNLGYTRAITIQAPVESVWPWLAQLGQGRGGLYSYDGLENLARCDIHSVNRIIPEMQNLRIGDLVRLGPKGYPCFSVAVVETGRALVLISANPQTGQPVYYMARVKKGYSAATWQFILEPRKNDTTRLLVRQRLSFSPDLALVWRLTEPVGFVMERRMLIGIKQRAEQSR